MKDYFCRNEFTNYRLATIGIDWSLGEKQRILPSEIHHVSLQIA